jgi:signal transduction histidine kinase
VGTLLARIARLPARRLVEADVAVAAGLILLTAVQDWSSGSPGVRAVAVALPVTVALRRLAPAPMALLTLAGAYVAGAEPSAALSIALALVFYTAGRRGGDRGRWLSGAGLVGAALLAVSLSSSVSLSGAPRLVAIVWTWGFFIAAPFAADWWIGSGARLNADLRASLERLEDEQEERARRAAVEERIRIARELHDVIAHNVSVMVIQTAAARRVVVSDRPAARRALTAVQASGREALADLRKMIGAVRRPDLDPDGAAVTGLAQLAALAERARASGVDLEISIEGEHRPLPATLDLVSFRVAQEAVTNAIKHAGPCRAWLRVAFGRSDLELDFTDTGRGPSSPQAVASLPPTGGGAGHGLAGMRERLTLYGGELDAGPLPGGGFRVRARLPLTATVPT